MTSATNITVKPLTFGSANENELLNNRGELLETPEARAWDAQAVAATIQQEQARADAGIVDPWEGLTERFAPDPSGSPDDPALAKIKTLVPAGATLVDAGAGAGRLAIPLASHCGKIVAVEPVPSMITALERHLRDRDIRNVDVATATWEEWATDRADSVDVVLMAHLLYGAAPITRFIQLANECAAEQVVVLLSTSQPVQYYYPLWQTVHGEERIPVPGAGAFHDLLVSWRITHEIQDLPALAPRPFKDLDSAVKRTARRLNVQPGSQGYGRVRLAVEDALIPVEGGFGFAWADPATPRLFWWRTDA